jgi:hypothetical protein
LAKAISQILRRVLHNKERSHSLIVSRPATVHVYLTYDSFLWPIPLFLFINVTNSAYYVNIHNSNFLFSLKNITSWQDSTLGLLLLLLPSLDENFRRRERDSELRGVVRRHDVELEHFKYGLKKTSQRIERKPKAR